MSSVVHETYTISQNMVQNNFDDQHWLELSPFDHQAGGMTRLFTISDSTICKPCMMRELVFYQSMPAALVPYTPSFTGLLDVQITKDDSGHTVPIGFPTYSTKLHNCDIIVNRDDHSDIRDPVLCLRRNLGRHHRSYEQELQHIDAIHRQTGQLKYMMFDNIVTGLRRPSVLDLKVGLRLYGDDHPLSERGWKMEKYTNTTSSTLGLRNCGMKVYDRVSDTYTALNKYESFNYDVAQFRDSIRAFLHDGTRLRRDIIRQMIRKIRQILNVVSEQDGIRFYAVSLLLVYDALADYNENVMQTVPNSIETPIPDSDERSNVDQCTEQTHTDTCCHSIVESFAINSIKYANDDRRTLPNSTPTDGVNFHNKSAAHSMTSLVEDATNAYGDISILSDTTIGGNDFLTNNCDTASGDMGNVEKNTEVTDHLTSIKDDISITANDQLNSTFETTNDQNSRDIQRDNDVIVNTNTSPIGNVHKDDTTLECDAIPHVQVRLIDFAHATHNQYPGSTIVHHGPHRGFIYGLENLIKILNEIDNSRT